MVYKGLGCIEEGRGSPNVPRVPGYLKTHIVVEEGRVSHSVYAAYTVRSIICLQELIGDIESDFSDSISLLQKLFSWENASLKTLLNLLQVSYTIVIKIKKSHPKK